MSDKAKEFCRKRLSDLFLLVVVLSVQLALIRLLRVSTSSAYLVVSSLVYAKLLSMDRRKDEEEGE